jgi:hypothetical protein
MGSASRGNAAEAAVLHALVKRGLDVFVPFGSGHPFDLAVYVLDTESEEVFLTPIDAVAATEGRLRFEPPRNNQRKRIRMAAEFEISAWTDERLASLAAATHAPAA